MNSPGLEHHRSFAPPLRATLATVLLAHALTGSAAPVSLEQAYRSALQTSESVKTSQAARDAADESYVQARGSILPQVSASGTFGRDPTLPSGQTDTTVKLTAQQPLFRGLSEYAALRGADDLREAASFDVGDAKLDLYVAVAESFYQVHTAERDLSHLTEAARLTGERVKELGERERIGRSRKSEVLAARSREAAALASIQSAQAELTVARERFSRVTGLGPETQLSAPSGGAVRDAVKFAEFYLRRVENRYDIQSLRRRFDATDEAVSVAWGAHLPQIDLSANYYVKRPSYLEDKSWDATLSVTLPLFAGGTIQSAVRENAAIRRQAELELEGARREAATDIRALHARASHLAAEFEARGRAVDLAERNYETHKRDYGFGAVTNLEVLDALNGVIEARREKDRTYFEFWSTVAALEAAAAIPPPGSGSLAAGREEP